MPVCTCPKAPGLPPCAAASCTKLCAGHVSSIPTLHVDPDQPNPRPVPIPNPNPNPNPLGSSGSAGSVTRLRRVFWWRFSKKTPGGRKTRLNQYHPHPAQSSVQGAASHRSSQAPAAFLNGPWASLYGNYSPGGNYGCSLVVWLLDVGWWLYLIDICLFARFF